MTSDLQRTTYDFQKSDLKKNIVNFNNLSTIKEILSKPCKLINDYKLKMDLFFIHFDFCVYVIILVMNLIKLTAL